MRSTSPGGGPYPRRVIACIIASSSVSSVMGSFPLNFLSRFDEVEFSAESAQVMLVTQITSLPALAYGIPTARIPAATSAKPSVDTRKPAPPVSSRFRTRDVFLLIWETFQMSPSRKQD